MLTFGEFVQKLNEANPAAQTPYTYALQQIQQAIGNVHPHQFSTRETQAEFDRAKRDVMLAIQKMQSGVPTMPVAKVA